MSVRSGHHGAWEISRPSCHAAAHTHTACACCKGAHPCQPPEAAKCCTYRSGGAQLAQNVAGVGPYEHIGAACVLVGREARAKNGQPAGDATKEWGGSGMCACLPALKEGSLACQGRNASRSSHDKAWQTSDRPGGSYSPGPSRHATPIGGGEAGNYWGGLGVDVRRSHHQQGQQQRVAAAREAWHCCRACCMPTVALAERGPGFASLAVCRK